MLYSLSVLLASLALPTLVATSAISPRASTVRDFSVVRPQSTTDITQPLILGIGFEANVSRQVTVSLRTANKTLQQIQILDWPEGKCETTTQGNNSVSHEFNSGGTGQYTATWNVTYRTSDTPNCPSSLGISSYEYEVYMGNYTFEVVSTSLDGNSHIPPEIMPMQFSRTFPLTDPVGSGAKLTLGKENGLMVAGVSLVAFIAAGVVL